MFNPSNLARRFATGIIAAQLAFGTVAASTLIGAAPASAAVLAQHGVWEGVTFIDDGQLVYGARTEMTRGGTAAFMVKGDTLWLVLTDPSWHLQRGGTVTARVEIDGTTYSGSATVGSDTIGISDVSFEVLKMFVDGAQAKVDLNDGDIVWTLDLDGFTASMADALRVYKESV